MSHPGPQPRPVPPGAAPAVSRTDGRTAKSSPPVTSRTRSSSISPPYHCERPRAPPGQRGIHVLKAETAKPLPMLHYYHSGSGTPTMRRSCRRFPFNPEPISLTSSSRRYPCRLAQSTTRPACRSRSSRWSPEETRRIPRSARQCGEADNVMTSVGKLLGPELRGACRYDAGGKWSPCETVEAAPAVRLMCSLIMITSMPYYYIIYNLLYTIFGIVAGPILTWAARQQPRRWATRWRGW